MHNLMHSLIRNTKLAREFSLRNASSVSCTNNDISFSGGEREVRRRRLRVELFEEMRNGVCDRHQGWTDLWVRSPLYDKDKPECVIWLVEMDNLGDTQGNTDSRNDSTSPCASKLYHSLLDLAGGNV